LGWRFGYLAVVSVDITICIVPVVIILIKEIAEYRRLTRAASILTDTGKKSIIVKVDHNPSYPDKEELIPRTASVNK
jgi:hypothetical protein